MLEPSPDHVATLDDLELAAGGYKREMPRQFSMWSLGALSFTLTCTWLGTGSSVGIALKEFSSVGVLWSLPVAGCMTLIPAAGMAELASAYPVAGAQYYWAFMVSSERYRAFASFFVGWIAILGWWLGSGSVSNFVASMILEIVSVWYPDYHLEHWHQYLIYVALIWLAIAINVFGSKWIPLYNQLTFVLSVLTLFGTTLCLFVISRNHHASASFIFSDTTNRSGWSSDGFSFVLAISNAVFAYLGADCGAHLAEEIPNPAKNVPRVILYPLLMGLLTAFPFTCALMYSITDIAAVLNTPTGLPLIEIYYQGTGSAVAASVLLALFAFCFFGCLVANATTSSRTLWAVSRDGVMPFSHIWMQVHPHFKMPLNAMLLTGTCVTVYGVIFLGSSTAFSAMVSAAIFFQQSSCVIPQAILLYRGRDRVLPPRHFNLGRFGVVINATAVAWVLFLDIIYCFPTSLPVTPQNMSYVSVVSTGLIGYVIILWFTTKRKSFQGPHVDLEVLERRRMAALHDGEVVIEGIPSKTAVVESAAGDVKSALPHLSERAASSDSELTDREIARG